MKLLVLGASGRTGRRVTKYAIEAGHSVAALVRERSVGRLEQGTETVVGEVLDEAVLQRAIDGRDAIISTLGLNRAHLSPWSRLESPPDLVAQVMGTLSRACVGRGAPRIVWMSAAGAGPSSRATSPLVRPLTRVANVGVAYRDLNVAERVMEESGATAIVARPVTLLNGPSSQPARPIARYRLLSVVRRSAVARWMVNAATGEESSSPLLLG